MPVIFHLVWIGLGLLAWLLLWAAAVRVIWSAKLRNAAEREQDRKDGFR